jgi:hypothetical protein
VAAVEQGEQLVGVAQQLGAGGGQRDAAAVALQEGGAELGLELADGDGQRGLAEAERAGGGGHAAEAGDLAEVAEVGEVHVSSSRRGGGAGGGPA